MAKNSIPGVLDVPRIQGSAKLTQTFPPAPAGMNVALSAAELDDTEARYLQDILVDYPGLARRRGPQRAVPNLAAHTRKGSGLALTLTPQGQTRLAALTGDGGSGFFSAYSADKTTKVDLTWPHPMPTDPASGISSAYRVVDVKAALGGGSWVGVSSAYDSNSPSQGLAYWRGGAKANYSTGTLTLARGSASVTGAGTSWLSNAEPGMFLFATTDEGFVQTLIGTVLSVNTDTSITLTSPSPYPATAKAYTLQSLRGFYGRVTTGKITADTSSATVSGGNTKFRSQGLGTGWWNLYRKSDFAWIGWVSTVASEISLTLTANAAISVANEAYIAIRADADWSIATTANANKVGFLNATYAERQWFANNGAQFDKTHRVWFSDTDDPEATDLSDDGDWIPVSSTGEIQEPIKALAPAYNALVVIKENETFAVTGSSPSEFAVKKLEDDGTLAGMSVQLYGGGVIWAGRQGIHFYDGIQSQNLTEAKLGDVWKNSILHTDPSRYRMWSMLVRNHYILFVEDLDPTIAVVKGNTASTPSTWTVAINMVTRAVTLMTNLHIRGAVTMPASEGQGVWYLVNDSTKANIASADALFDEEGVDTVVADGGVAGPDFFFESKKFDAGDALRLKRFKQLAIHYLVQGGDIKIDTVLGLNDVGKTLSTTFPASVYTWDGLHVVVSTWDALKTQFSTWDDVIQSVLVPKKVRFMKKSQHMSFRLYQSSSAISRLKIGPYQILYKVMRPGRV